MASKQSTGVKVTEQGRQLELLQQREELPLPSADELSKLNALNPKLVDIAVEEAVAEMKHRRDSTDSINKFVSRERMFALLIAIALPVIGMGCAMYLALQDHDRVAIAVALGSVAPVVSAIFKSKF